MSLLLTTSTLERIVEFFATVAEDENDKQTSTPRPTWTRRMEFMRHMRIDLDEYLSSRAETCGSRAPVNPGLRDVWFQAAEEEIARRGALPHDGEEPVPILHGSAVMLRCSYCDDGL